MDPSNSQNNMPNNKANNNPDNKANNNASNNPDNSPNNSPSNKPSNSPSNKPSNSPSNKPSNSPNANSRTLKYIAKAAIIAALYAGITILLAPLSYGQIQVRIAEAFTVLPAVTSAAIPGLFAGCILANYFGGNGPYDIIFGSLATLVAALLTFYIRRFVSKHTREGKKLSVLLIPLPPVVINAVVVGFLLNYLYQLPLIATIGFVAAGQTVACYGMGLPLYLRIRNNKIFLDQ